MLGNNLTPIVKNLLIANAGVFLVANLFNFEEVSAFMALRYFESSQFKLHTIITHMFMHADFMHLFFNMFALFMFGPALENVWGPKRFLLFYIVCGIGAALVYTGVNAFEYHHLEQSIDAFRMNPDPYTFELILHKKFGAFQRFPQLTEYFTELPNAYKQDPKNPALIRQSIDVLESFYQIKMNGPMVGASGAVFGILLGFGMLFPNTPLLLLFFPVPIKAKYFVMIYGALELFAGIRNNPNDNVAHYAHLGGMIFAFILIKYWQKQRNSFY